MGNDRTPYWVHVSPQTGWVTLFHSIDGQPYEVVSEIGVWGDAHPIAEKISNLVRRILIDAPRARRWRRATRRMKELGRKLNGGDVTVES